MHAAPHRPVCMTVPELVSRCTSVVSHAVAVLSRTARARRIFSRIGATFAVHLKARGFSLCSSRYERIALTNCFTFRNVLRRSRFSVISRNQRSIRFNHELLVGVK